MILSSKEPKIAYFVSPHGFGHAARAASVMQALHRLDSSIHFEIFTQVPIWFFQESLSGAFTYHDLLTDIGLVQKNPLVEDLPATIERLNQFLPFNPSQIRSVANQIVETRCYAIVCDIAPMGIAVAKEVGIPSILVENFTWDWIYEGYTKEDPRINQPINCLQALFKAADYRIQTEPVCCYYKADLVTTPVSRKIRTPVFQVRERLRIPDEARIVLITLGGIPGQYRFLEQLETQNSIYFLIPGASESIQLSNNLILLPHHSHFYHPDLVHTCNAVVGKLGYSTVAEVYQAGVPFGYIMRERFRESPVLAEYVRTRMKGLAIAKDEFQDGRWLSQLPDLLALPRIQRNDSNGADQIAKFIHKLLCTRLF
jgi:hypothetical protein